MNYKEVYFIIFCYIINKLFLIFLRINDKLKIFEQKIIFIKIKINSNTKTSESILCVTYTSFFGLKIY
jgi:hypothetical protein